MAAKPLPQKTKESIIADWRTGEYSQHFLADKHKVSSGVVNKLCKGIAQDTKDIVNAGEAYKRGLAEQDERSVHAINEVVDRRTRWLIYLENMAVKNVQEAMKAPCENQNDFKARSSTISAAKEVLEPKQGVSVQVNQQVASFDASKLSTHVLAEIMAAKDAEQG